MVADVRDTGLPSEFATSPEVRDTGRPPDNPPKGVILPTPASVQPAPGRVRIWSYNPVLTLISLYGEAAPKIVDGFGGWELVTIPHREALTQWTGKNPVAIELSLIIESPDYANHINCEKDIKTLERLAGVDDPDDQPPIVHWSGHGPHDYSRNPGWEWFIETLEFDDAQGNRFGNRIRQPATVTLRRYNPGSYIKKRKNKKPPKKGAKKKTYKVKKSDLKGGLQGIAKRQLGSAKRWRQIARLNKIRDPKKIHVGQVLKMP